MDKKKISKEAQDYYRSGYNCAQSVGMALKDGGITMSPELLNALGGFGSGLGGSGCICGALAGGVIIASSKDPVKARGRANLLHDAFKNEFKTTCCRVLRTKNQCQEYVRFMTEKTLEVIE